MSKADRDRQALLQRLAREQRRALDAAAHLLLSICKSFFPYFR